MAAIPGRPAPWLTGELAGRCAPELGTAGGRCVALEGGALGGHEATAEAQRHDVQLSERPLARELCLALGRGSAHSPSAAGHVFDADAQVRPNGISWSVVTRACEEASQWRSALLHLDLPDSEPSRAPVVAALCAVRSWRRAVCLGDAHGAGSWPWERALLAAPEELPGRCLSRFRSVSP